MRPADLLHAIFLRLKQDEVGNRAALDFIVTVYTLSETELGRKWKPHLTKDWFQHACYTEISLRFVCSPKWLESLTEEEFEVYRYLFQAEFQRRVGGLQCRDGSLDHIFLEWIHPELVRRGILKEQNDTCVKEAT